MLRAQRQQKGGFRVKGEQVRAETWQQGGKWSKEGINPMVERKKQRAGEERERERERTRPIPKAAANPRAKLG